MRSARRALWRGCSTPRSGRSGSATGSSRSYGAQSPRAAFDRRACAVPRHGPDIPDGGPQAARTAGLVRIEADKTDRRSRLIQITPEGVALTRSRPAHVARDSCPVGRHPGRGHPQPPSSGPAASAARRRDIVGLSIQARRPRVSWMRRLLRPRPVGAEAPQVALRIAAGEFAAAVVAVGQPLLDHDARGSTRSCSASTSSTAM
jgi:hypothetical protein